MNEVYNTTKIDRQVEHIENHIREKTRDVAQNLRHLANMVDKIADSKTVDTIPGDLAYAIENGIANARVELPAVWFGNLRAVEREIWREASNGE